MSKKSEKVNHQHKAPNKPPEQGASVRHQDPEPGQNSIDTATLTPTQTYQNRHFIGLINAVLNGIVTVDETFRITTFNPAAEVIFGVEAREVLSKSLHLLIPAQQSSISGENIFSGQPFHGGRELDASELELGDMGCPKIWRSVIGRRSNGAEFFMDISVYHSPFGDTTFTTFIIDDISDRIEAAKEHQENLQRFQALTNLAPVGIIQLDTHWSCIYVNDTWFELSGYGKEETLLKGWINAIHQKDANLVLQKLRTTLKEDQYFTYEFRLRTPKGGTIWVKANARSLYNDEKEVSGYLFTFSDITNHRQIEKKLRQMAEFDPLTHLANRSYFQNSLKQALNQSKNSASIVLFFIDLDGFKSVNDSLGHGTGDELLKLAAKRILNCVRKSDTVARIGGDEFTVILTHNKNLDFATVIATKIVEAIRKPFIVNGQEIFISTSLGIASGKKPNTDPETLTKQADIALFRAKALGKNKYQFFTPELDAQAKATMFLSSGLHRAIERNEFKLYYQPQISIADNKVMGVEALLRWHHPQIGEVSPERFIPLLEETGLIEEVGRWIIKKACEQMAKWKKALSASQPPIKLSINISARQLKDPGLTQYIEQTLHQTQLSAESVIIEITESVFLENIEDNHSILNELKRIGVELSLDDFGTGYSSLAYLKKFPIDQLKIDRSFINDIQHDPDDRAIVQAIIALAKSLHLDVIAEGVESRNTLVLLQRMQCTHYQGFYYSRPVPADLIASHLDSTRTAKSPQIINTQPIMTPIDS